MALSLSRLLVIQQNCGFGHAHLKAIVILNYQNTYHFHLNYSRIQKFQTAAYIYIIMLGQTKKKTTPNFLSN